MSFVTTFGTLSLPIDMDRNRAALSIWWALRTSVSCLAVNAALDRNYVNVTVCVNKMFVRVSERVMALAMNMTCTLGTRSRASLALSCWNEKPDFS